MQVKDRELNRRGVKVRRPWCGFFSRRKLVHGKQKRGVRSAQDCRKHGKLHYQCLEEMVLRREQAIQSLRRELETVNICYMFHSSLCQLNVASCTFSLSS